MTPHDQEYDSKKLKIEQGISKCRDTISVMEVKLKKVLDRVKSSQSSGSSPKKRSSRHASSHSNTNSNSNSNSRSFVEESKSGNVSGVTDPPQRNISDVPVMISTTKDRSSRAARKD